jgi:hypothetical protein
MKDLSRYNELPTSSSHSIYMEQILRETVSGYILLLVHLLTPTAKRVRRPDSSHGSL